MSGHGFHVHGPHDHELEHAAEHGGADSFAGRIAVTTAIVATIGALMSYQGGATQANAGLYKNNAAIKKTEASNQWNYYQAKSNKQNLAELALSLQTAPDKQEFYRQEAARYDKEKKDIKIAADKLEDEAKAWDKKSDEQLHQHHRWAQATTALQIAIALSAIALLTKRAWLLRGVYAVAGLGVVLGGLAFAHI
jgi:predicted RNA-binding Zn ribbon-like protein